MCAVLNSTLQPACLIETGTSRTSESGSARETGAGWTAWLRRHGWRLCSCQRRTRQPERSPPPLTFASSIAHRDHMGIAAPRPRLSEFARSGPARQISRRTSRSHPRSPKDVEQRQHSSTRSSQARSQTTNGNQKPVGNHSRNHDASVPTLRLRMRRLASPTEVTGSDRWIVLPCSALRCRR